MDRPICDADGAADAIRQPVVQPDRDVRPFQDVLIDLGARLGLPGLVKEDGSAKYPGFFPDYMVNHERRPGIGMLAGWRGASGGEHGKGAPNPKQIESYIAHGCFWRHELAENQRFFRHANRDYLQWAAEFGLVDRVEQIVLQIYSEPLQRFRLAADGHGLVHPPEQHRERLRKHFDPLPIWYAPFEEAAIETRDFPLHALTQRPMAMYHSWGSQNAWLRQIHGRNHLYINRQTAKRLDLADDDWVWLISHHGRIKVPVKAMEGVNPDTVWTWNAIGKRRGAWNLDPRAAEGRKGFLLNHLISELLPPKADGHRYSNSDPITGQAAWYDLRVRIERADENDWPQSEPQFADLKAPVSHEKPALLRYGAKFRGRGE
jgi:anaerobic selenocysteine-containing dehydrogenase